MSQRTWIYLTVLVVVLLGASVFFWWIYKSGRIAPKAAPTPTPTPTTFSDVPSNYWAFREIEAVNATGIMIGYSEFKPEGTLTRAEAATIIGRTYNKTATPSTPSFSDVPTTNPAFQYIEGLKAIGWLEGYPDGTFKPDLPVDRATLAIMAATANAGGKDAVPSGDVTSPYSDVQTTDPAFKFIYFCKINNILSGYPDGTFKPTNNATRAEAAAAIARAAGKTASPAPSTASFTDVATSYWAFAEIEGLKAAGGISGYLPTFKPDNTADRATVAVAIARAKAGSDAAIPMPGNIQSYSDVPRTFWAFKHIEYLKTQTPPVMIGFEDGTFKPNDVASRETIAVVLARAKGLTIDPNITQTFVDVAPGDPGYAEIEAVYKATYTKGCRQDTTGIYFCPTADLTRATLAAFAYNAFLGPVVNTSPSLPLSPPISSSPNIVSSPSISPSISPSGSSPTPGASPSQVALASPSSSAGTGSGSGAGSGTGTGTGSGTSAKTGPEIPLASGGLLVFLFAARYLVRRGIK